MRQRKWMKKFISLALCAVMTLGMFPAGPVHAAGTPLDVVENGKVSDPATLNNWKNYFPVSGTISTEYAGGVWSDKSVFTTVDSYLAATDETEEYSLSMKDAENNFLVALSAMASTKSIKGYSSIPTDTILVLDMSSSMRNDIDDLAAAANQAVKTLLDVNYNNRVGVVLYSGNKDSSVLLELDRYTTGSASGNYLEYYTNSDNKGGIQVVSGVTGSDGIAETGKDYYHSGTFTQDGVYIAMKQLLAADKTVKDGIQAGEERMPIIVLMTDGAPTLLSNNYTGTSGTANQLSANTSVAEGSSKDFMNQVQAAYAKYMLENSANGYQEHDLLFYTLGFNVTKENAPALWPTANGETKNYWDTLLAGRRATANDGMGISIAGTDFLAALNSTDAAHLRENGTNKYYYYVDQYFSASGGNLDTAFRSIVNEIILQSLYFPTLIEDGDTHHVGGYLEFTDVIGDYMEVADIKGIQLGDTLFTGAAFTSALATGEMGTESKPTDLGNNFVWSVKERLHITDTDTAWDLIENAWNSGQLSYANDNVFSNYVGWYGNLNSKNEMVYQSWWNGDMQAAKQSGNAYAIKSYGFQGNVVQGHRVTDMYYISVQVRTHIASGKTEVHFRIPASLIPLVEYEVELNSTDLSNVKNLGVGGASAPIRLLFEVGLRSDINSLNVMEKISANYPYYDSETGTYNFYTNKWDPKHGDSVIPEAENNTSVWFEPSEENERYYFHEDTPVKTGANGQYTERYVYVKSNGTTTATLKSEVLPAVAAGKVENGKIPAGTPRLDTARDPVDKKDPADPTKSGNFTGTQPHFEHPQIVQNPSYHLGAILGNNGKLSVHAAQGIKLTKLIQSADGHILPADQVYTFEIANVGVSQTYQTYLEADGQLAPVQTVTSDTNGILTVTLTKNQSIYIVGLPEGDYTVSEQINGDYMVSSFTVNGQTAANGGTVSVADNALTDVTVTNVPKIYGDVIIGKNVISSYNDHLTSAFKYRLDVSITNAAAGTYKTVIAHADGTIADGTSVTTGIDGTGSSTVDLSYGEAITIKELPEDAVVAVTETHVMKGGTEEALTDSGFTATMQPAASVTAKSGETVYINVTNTYAPKAVAPGNVQLQIMKELDGIEYWHGGSFEFILEKHVTTAAGVSHQQIGNPISISYSGSSDNPVKYSGVLDLTTLGEIAYTEPGVYSYRISEVSGSENGMLYDQAYAYFDVHVEDNGLGELVITSVTAGTDAVVSPTYDPADALKQTGWLVEADFFNTYSVDGAASMLLNIKKEVTSESGATYSPEGFRFGLYKTGADHVVPDGASAARIVVTNAAGVATIRETFTASDLLDGATKYYVLREENPNQNYIGYAPQEHKITIKLSNVNGQLSMTKTVLHPAGNTTSNTATTGALAVHPALSGGEITLTPAAEGNIYYRIGDGQANSYTVPFAAPGSAAMIYAWTETAEGTKSDEVAAYYDNVVGSLTVSAVVRIAVEAEFVNTYSPAPASLTLSGTKTLSGRNWNESDSFTFELYQTDSTFVVAEGTQPVKTASAELAENGDPTAAQGFSFNLAFDTVGTYHYVIKEQQLSDNNITYDAAEYHVTVSVADNGAGQLTATATTQKVVDGEAVTVPVTFTNTYTPEPAPVKIEAHKELHYVNDNNRLLSFSEGVFNFELYKAELSNGKIVPIEGIMPVSMPVGAATPENGNIGKATFASSYDISDAGKTYYYLIKEVVPTGELNGGYYDTDSYPVKVTVTYDDSLGKLHVSVDYLKPNTTDEELTNEFHTIVNTYTAASTSVSMAGKKLLHDEARVDGAFQVVLYTADSDYTIIDGGTSKTVKTENLEGSFAYSFEYTKPGTYHYVIKEQAGEDTLMQYDSTVYQVEVVVHDNGRGKLIAEKTVTIKDLPTTEDIDIIFNNVRVRPDDLTVNMEIAKTVLGVSSNENFAFVLQQTGANYTDVIGAPTSITVNGSNVVNQELVFTEEHLNQTFYYTLSETPGTTQGMIYDDMQYRFKVQIALDEEKNLIASITDETVYLDGQTQLSITAATEDEADKVTAPFTNENYPNIDVSIDVTKRIDNLGSKKLSPKGFQFVLTKYTDSTYTTVETSETVTSNDSGSAFFEELSFTTEDVGKTFYYTISEIEGSKAGVTYDNTVYKVTITVARDDTTGLKAVITCDPTGTVIGNHLNVGFVNQYYKKPWWPITPSDPGPVDPVDPTDPVKPEVKPDVPVTPDTGDSNHLVLWAAVMAAGAIGFLTTMICAILRRKHSR